MTEHWGGAQWVLATLMVVGAVLPMPFRMAGLSKKSAVDWAGWYIGSLLEKVSLAALLWWGGFWG